MILRTGTDIIAVQRVRDAIERTGERFLSRLFTERERLYCDGRADPPLHYAGRFAAKEALFKALSSLEGTIPLLELEVLNQHNGEPYLELGPTLSSRWADLKPTNVSISISHCKEYATAVAIWLEI